MDGPFGLPRRAVHGYILGPGHGGQHGLHPGRRSIELIQVFAVELHHHGGVAAGDVVIHPVPEVGLHLEGGARNGLEGLPHPVGRVGGRIGLQLDVELTELGAHGVVAPLGAARTLGDGAHGGDLRQCSGHALAQMQALP
ncbi:hypothetical protein GALL_530220 [mine drainage metagenome]|uniref:Uncharacterized protein n=1 Tax=mine drainage metagenome TaxID=410659 RepID=A0A1J5PJG7_9ZZZZ